MDGQILALLALSGTLTAGSIAMAGHVHDLLGPEARLDLVLEHHVESVARDAHGAPLPFIDDDAPRVPVAILDFGAGTPIDRGAVTFAGVN